MKLNKVNKINFNHKNYVLVINWNNFEDTNHLIKLINKYIKTKHHLVLINNGSTNNSKYQFLKLLGCSNRKFLSNKQYVLRLEKIMYKYRLLKGIGWTFIDTNENYGFTGACNIGFKIILENPNAENVLLLNNDLTLETNVLEHLIDVSVVNHADVAGATIYDFEGKNIQFYGRKWPQMLFGRPTFRINPVGDYWNADMAEGSAMLIKTALLRRRFQKDGYFFDPKYFMYCEETDLCLFVKNEGGNIVIGKNARVNHKTSKILGGFGNNLTIYYQKRNEFYLAKKWLPISTFLLFLPFQILYNITVSIYLIIRNKVRPSYLKFAIKGICHAYLGITGKAVGHS